MITAIIQNGAYIGVSNGMPAVPYINPSASGAGMPRWNHARSCMEVFDGNMWVTLGGQASVGLTPEAVEILDWAKAKKAQEQRIKELADEHPGIRDLKEKLDIMIALVEKDKV